MAAEIAVYIDDVIVAEGTYEYCATALGYSRSTLVSYASARVRPSTRVSVRKLPPLYRLHGECEPIEEEEACLRLGFDHRKLLTRASDPRFRKVVRYMRQPWALPADIVAQLWDGSFKSQGDNSLLPNMAVVQQAQEDALVIPVA